MGTQCTWLYAITCTDNDWLNVNNFVDAVCSEKEKYKTKLKYLAFFERSDRSYKSQYKQFLGFTYINVLQNDYIITHYTVANSRSPSSSRTAMDKSLQTIQDLWESLLRTTPMPVNTCFLLTA